MPTANPPELTAAELELKRRGRRRLVGALTLGVLAIVVLPMIFDSEPRRKQADRQEIEVQIPSKDGQPPLPAPIAPQAETVPKDVPPAAGVVAKADTKATTPADVATVKPPAAAVDKSSKTTAEGAAAAPTKSVPAKPEMKADGAPASGAATTTPVVTAKASAATSAMAGYVVQLGAYKDADNAKALVLRMKEAKLPVFTDVLPVKTGTVTRVRVGPFPTKDKAESALAQVKLAGVDGKVVPLP